MCFAGFDNRSNSFLKFTYSLISLKNQFLAIKYLNSYWKVLENFRQLNQFAKFHSHIHIFAGIRDENYANQNEEKKISIEFTYSHISHILEKNFEMWICDAYAPPPFRQRFWWKTLKLICFGDGSVGKDNRLFFKIFTKIIFCSPEWFQKTK